MRNRASICPSDWFYGIRKSIDASVIRKVFAGVASEKWFNAELFRYIAATKLKGLTVYPERNKNDLAICVSTAGCESIPEVYFVTKHVYSIYPPDVRDGKITELLLKLAPREDGAKCYGIILGVYSHSETPENVSETFSVFRRDILKRTRRCIEKMPFMVRLSKQSMATFVKEDSVTIGETTVRVGLVLNGRRYQKSGSQAHQC